MKSAINNVICAGCNSHLYGGRTVLADDGSRYHPGCFRCSSCGVSLVGSPKVLRLQGRMMCASCSAKFAPNCATCRHAIHNKEFLYLAPAYYHPDHLTCRGCGSTDLASTGFVIFGGGDPLCLPCGLANKNLICCGCGQLITDEFLTHGCRRWHLKCFRCSQCRKSIKLGTQRMNIATGQLACQTCCAEAAVTSHLTLAVAMPAVAALLESDPNNAAVLSRRPWGQVTGCDLPFDPCSVVLNGQQPDQELMEQMRKQQEQQQAMAQKCTMTALLQQGYHRQQIQQVIQTIELLQKTVISSRRPAGSQPSEKQISSKRPQKSKLQQKRKKAAGEVHHEAGQWGQPEEGRCGQP